MSPKRPRSRGVVTPVTAAAHWRPTFFSRKHPTGPTRNATSDSAVIERPSKHDDQSPLISCRRYGGGRGKLKEFHTQHFIAAAARNGVRVWARANPATPATAAARAQQTETDVGGVVAEIPPWTAPAEDNDDADGPEKTHGRRVEQEEGEGEEGEGEDEEDDEEGAHPRRVGRGGAFGMMFNRNTGPTPVTNFGFVSEDTLLCAGSGFFALFRLTAADASALPVQEAHPTPMGKGKKKLVKKVTDELGTNGVSCRLQDHVDVVFESCTMVGPYIVGDMDAFPDTYNLNVFCVDLGDANAAPAADPDAAAPPATAPWTTALQRSSEAVQGRGPQFLSVQYGVADATGTVSFVPFRAADRLPGTCEPSCGREETDEEDNDAEVEGEGDDGSDEDGTRHSSFDKVSRAVTSGSSFDMCDEDKAAEDSHEDEDEDEGSDGDKEDAVCCLGYEQSFTKFKDTLPHPSGRLCPPSTVSPFGASMLVIYPRCEYWRYGHHNAPVFDMRSLRLIADLPVEDGETPDQLCAHGSIAAVHARDTVPTTLWDLTAALTAARTAELVPCQAPPTHADPENDLVLSKAAKGQGERPPPVALGYAKASVPPAHVTRLHVPSPAQVKLFTEDFGAAFSPQSEQLVVDLLQAATPQDAVAVAEAGLARGARLNSCMGGDTIASPLGVAVVTKNLLLAKWLLSHGASPDYHPASNTSQDNDAVCSTSDVHASDEDESEASDDEEGESSCGANGDATQTVRWSATQQKLEAFLRLFNGEEVDAVAFEAEKLALDATQLMSACNDGQLSAVRKLLGVTKGMKDFSTFTPRLTVPPQAIESALLSHDRKKAVPVVKVLVSVATSPHHPTVHINTAVFLHACAADPALEPVLAAVCPASLHYRLFNAVQVLDLDRASAALSSEESRAVRMDCGTPMPGAGLTALHAAVRRQHAGAVAFCLEHGGTTALLARDNRGHTPVSLAVRGGHPLVLEQLVTAGAAAGVDVEGEVQRLVATREMVLAVQAGDFEEASAAAQRGAYVDRIDPDTHETLLATLASRDISRECFHQACQQQPRPPQEVQDAMLAERMEAWQAALILVVETLGADATVELPPVAVDQARARVSRMTHAQATVDVGRLRVGHSGQPRPTALQIAATPFAKEVIAARQSLDDQLCYLCCTAPEHRNKKARKRNGEDIDSASSDALTARILDVIARGANVNYQSFREAHWLGVTPLHIALQNKDVETVEILLKAGADVCSIKAGVPFTGALHTDSGAGPEPEVLEGSVGVKTSVFSVHPSFRAGRMGRADVCGKTALEIAHSDAESLFLLRAYARAAASGQPPIVPVYTLLIQAIRNRDPTAVADVLSSRDPGEVADALRFAVSVSEGGETDDGQSLVAAAWSEVLRCENFAPKRSNMAPLDLEGCITAAQTLTPDTLDDFMAHRRLAPALRVLVSITSHAAAAPTVQARLAAIHAGHLGCMTRGSDEQVARFIAVLEACVALHDAEATPSENETLPAAVYRAALDAAARSSTHPSVALVLMMASRAFLPNVDPAELIYAAPAVGAKEKKRRAQGQRGMVMICGSGSKSKESVMELIFETSRHQPVLIPVTSVADSFGADTGGFSKVTVIEAMARLWSAQVIPPPPSALAEQLFTSDATVFDRAALAPVIAAVDAKYQKHCLTPDSVRMLALAHHNTVVRDTRPDSGPVSTLRFEVDPDTPLLMQAYNVLTKSGSTADVNAHGEDGMTLLHHAVCVCDTGLVVALLRRDDIDASVKNDPGDLPHAVFPRHVTPDFVGWHVLAQLLRLRRKSQQAIVAGRETAAAVITDAAIAEARPLAVQSAFLCQAVDMRFSSQAPGELTAMIDAALADGADINGVVPTGVLPAGEFVKECHGPSLLHAAHCGAVTPYLAALVDRGARLTEAQATEARAALSGGFRGGDDLNAALRVIAAASANTQAPLSAMAALKVQSTEEVQLGSDSGAAGGLVTRDVSATNKGQKGHEGHQKEVTLESITAEKAQQLEDAMLHKLVTEGGPQRGSNFQDLAMLVQGFSNSFSSAKKSGGPSMFGPGTADWATFDSATKRRMLGHAFAARATRSAPLSSNDVAVIRQYFLSDLSLMSIDEVVVSPLVGLVAAALRAGEGGALFAAVTEHGGDKGAYVHTAALVFHALSIGDTAALEWAMKHAPALPVDGEAKVTSWSMVLRTQEFAADVGKAVAAAIENAKGPVVYSHIESIPRLDHPVAEILQKHLPLTPATVALLGHSVSAFSA